MSVREKKKEGISSKDRAGMLPRMPPHPLLDETCGSALSLLFTRLETDDS